MSKVAVLNSTLCGQTLVDVFLLSRGSTAAGTAAGTTAAAAAAAACLGGHLLIASATVSGTALSSFGEEGIDRTHVLELVHSCDWVLVSVVCFGWEFCSSCGKLKMEGRKSRRCGHYYTLMLLPTCETRRFQLSQGHSNFDSFDPTTAS